MEIWGGVYNLQLNEVQKYSLLIASAESSATPKRKRVLTSRSLEVTCQLLNCFEGASKCPMNPSWHLRCDILDKLC